MFVYGLALIYGLTLILMFHVDKKIESKNTMMKLIEEFKRKELRAARSHRFYR